MYDSVMNSSMMRIAQEKGILDFHAYDLRDWTHDRHRTTDDDPYGGGAGLVMKCEPLFEAYDEICSSGEGRDFGSCPEQADWAASTKRVPHEPAAPCGLSARAGLPSDWAPPDQPARRSRTAPSPAPSSSRRRASASATKPRSNLPKRSASCLFAGTTKASTSAPIRWRIASYRLGITCSRAASSPRWSCHRRRGPQAPRRARCRGRGDRRKLLRRPFGVSPVHAPCRSSAECGFPTCFSRETMGRWRNGAASRACAYCPPAPRLACRRGAFTR